MRNKLLSIILFSIVAGLGTYYIRPRILPPIIAPTPQYCVELSEDGEINFKRFPITESIHIIVNNGKLTGIQMIDISGAK